MWIASVATGCVSTAVKQAYVTPLLKKTGLDVNTAANYRPVSNLAVLSKLLEKTVSQQIEGHLSREGHFPSHRKHHSTETVLTRVCSNITRLDKGDFALMAFLDSDLWHSTSQFWSTICHIRFVSMRLHMNGLDHIWQAELSMCYSGVSSRTLEYGVPQGSVLVPLFFVLYTADLELTACRHSVEAHFYVDDSQMYIFSKPSDATTSENRLLSYLDDNAAWMKSNHLNLNSMTQFMRCATSCHQG